jgi:hypothetical protein
MVVLCGLCVVGVPAGAQTGAADTRYSASQLNCAQFLETSDSKIHTESGGQVREQTAGRTAVWQFRAVTAVEGISLEGWLDTLSLWRKSPEGTLRPDTDGLLGGRYRGILKETGSFTSQVRPFIPDEVAEVAGMSTALDDFFPPLPGRPLRPGQAWTNSAGVSLRRMADSGLSGVPVYRYELNIRRQTRSTPVANDTAPLGLTQVSREYGSYVWHPSLGLIRRDRQIVIETQVPAGRVIRQPVRSRIEQRITVVRKLDTEKNRGGC